MQTLRQCVRFNLIIACAASAMLQQQESCPCNVQSWYLQGALHTARQQCMAARDR